MNDIQEVADVLNSRRKYWGDRATRRVLGFFQKADGGVKITESWRPFAALLSGSTFMTSLLSWLAQRWTEVTGGSCPHLSSWGLAQLA
jgi:hypothetical protein